MVPRHVVIGIFAVSLAAVNSTMGSSLLSVGLEDLRGAWGLGVDEAAYVPTAFNAAQMFMGPVSILLAARFGHRQVLLYAGGFYALTSIFLPVVAPNIVAIVFFLVLGGLSSGTFYPLCLSFISRNLPASIVTFGIAAYNLDLLVTNHVVHALEGFYILHANWKWLFWNQALLSVPMFFSMYYGITETPKDQLVSGFKWDGICYTAGALTLFYIALDQGERLDWYNNGLINGLVFAGLLLLASAIIHRRYSPNPYLDFAYLHRRNILLMGFVLVAYRTMLVRVTFIIPLFLETLHQYRPTESGLLFCLSIIPFIFAMPIFAFLMRRVHVRIILTIGLVLLALANFHDSHTLATWMWFQFIPSQMIAAVGICMVAMGTIAGIVFEGRMSGAYKNRAGAYAQGAFFQAARLFGTISSVSAFRRFLLFRQHFWQTKLVSDIQSSSFEECGDFLGVSLAPQASAPLQAQELGKHLISQNIESQAFTLAIDDAFMLLAWVSVICLIAVSMMVKVPLPRDLPEPNN